MKFFKQCNFEFDEQKEESTGQQTADSLDTLENNCGTDLLIK